ncbi:hypothetical protein C8J56DRAFT_798201 [Mycena floridula]|nr:hypothetical protein C8J56DRAFT_798201 [Mycena floridula]
MYDDIPYEIWKQIANYLPKGQLFQLITLSRVWYQIVLDEQYREISWVTMDEKALKRILEVRHVVKKIRVRRLHVRAWFLQYLVKRKELMRKSERKSKLNVLWDIVRRPEAPKGPVVIDFRSPKAVIEAMIAAVHAMTNVTDYSFEWRDLPMTPETQLFLTSVRQSFGVSLRKLDLHAQISNFEQLLSIVDFHGLEDVRLHFDYNSSVITQDEINHILRNCIAPFVNHFSSSLHIFGLTSVADMDLSVLFRALDRMSSLHRLELHSIFDQTSLSDPSGLAKLLDTHSSTLVDLSFELRPVRQRSWNEMALRLFSSPRALSNLESLSLTPFDSLRIPLLGPFFRQCLRRSEHSLTSLTLKDWLLTSEIVEEITAMFSHRPLDRGLRYLHVEISRHASLPTVLDIVAKNLPGLVSLHLITEGYRDPRAV